MPADFFREIFGQTNKDAAQRDLADYDPKTGTVDRGVIERLSDRLLRGGSEGVNEAAKQAYIEDLESTRLGQEIIKSRPDYVFTGKDTKASLARTFKEAQIQDQLIDSIQNTGESLKTRAELEGIDSGQLRAMLPGLKQKAQTTAHANNPFIQRQLIDRADDKADRRRAELAARKERFEIREDNKLEAAKQRQADLKLSMSDLDLRRQQQANEMAMFNQREERAERGDRKERIAAIMASLANLGGAFAI